jgi:hypothetical protein
MVPRTTRSSSKSWQRLPAEPNRENDLRDPLPAMNTGHRSRPVGGPEDVARERRKSTMSWITWAREYGWNTPQHGTLKSSFLRAGIEHGRRRFCAPPREPSSDTRASLCAIRRTLPSRAAIDRPASGMVARLSRRFRLALPMNVPNHWSSGSSKPSGRTAAGTVIAGRAGAPPRSPKASFRWVPSPCIPGSLETNTVTSLQNAPASSFWLADCSAAVMGAIRNRPGPN